MQGILIHLASTHVPLGRLFGSPMHTASTETISPDHIIGGKTCARNPGKCPTISSDPIVFMKVALICQLICILLRKITEQYNSSDKILFQL